MKSPEIITKVGFRASCWPESDSKSTVMKRNQLHEVAKNDSKGPEMVLTQPESVPDSRVVMAEIARNDHQPSISGFILARFRVKRLRDEPKSA